ncbi:MAG: PKD domain-containing protein [Candidatus Kapabacteria bacterium]|nr:PKD domain-containing protein [Candidatus Kapabacteria bacterium]
MLFTLRLIAIAAFIFAANLNLFSQQDTSGWVQSGDNILLNKHDIGTILQAGLSSTGDSIWTFSDDDGYYFRIWELKSGIMVHEKTLSDRYFISADFQTYHNNHATEFKLYDIKTDSLLLSHNFFTSVYDDVQAASFHYDSKRTLLHMAYYNWEYNSRGPIPKRGMKVYKLSDVPELINHNSIEIGFKLNHDYTRMAFPRENNSIATYDIVNQKFTELGYTGQMITSVLFTSNPKHVSARYAGNILSIWNVNTKQMISKTNLKQKFFTYSFADNDKFIVGEVNFCFVLIDIITGALIESTEHYLVNIRYILGNSPHGFVFISDNKFGLVNFDILGDKDIIQFAPDSSLIYAGNSATLHNLSNFEYDSIEWELSDGRKSNQETPSFDFNTPGLFDVTLRLTKDGELFTLTKKNIIEVYPVMEVDFDSDVKYGKSPLTVQFEDKSSGIVDEYIWKVNDEVFSKEKNPKYVFTTSGRFNISLTVRDRLSTKVITKPYFIQVDRENIEFLEVLISRSELFWNTESPPKHEDFISVVQTVKQEDTLNIILSLSSYVTWDDGFHHATFDNFLQLNSKDLNLVRSSSWNYIYWGMTVSSYSNLIYHNNSFFYSKHGRSADNPSFLSRISTIDNKHQMESKYINFPMRNGKKVLSFDDDKLVVCGTSRLGQTNIYMFNSVFELFNQDSIQEFMIDAVNFMIKNHFYNAYKRHSSFDL